MAAELLNVPKLTIRHYKNKSLYDSYSGSRKDGDISIIGDSMSVYGISVIDDLVSKVNANIEINANKLKEIAESGISQINGQISDIKANTYTKVEVDNNFQPKGDYVYKEEYDSDQNNMYDLIDKKAYISDVYTKDEVDEKVTGLSKNVYTKVETDGKFQLKGNYATIGYVTDHISSFKKNVDRELDNRLSVKVDKNEVYTKDEVYTKNEVYTKEEVYTKDEVTNTCLSKFNFKDKLLEVLGVRYSIEENGYICFGSLFGGLIIQWGKIQKSFSGYKHHENVTIEFPIEFSKPPKIQQTYYFNDKWEYDTDYFNIIYSVTAKNYKTWIGGADGIHWFAIGY